RVERVHVALHRPLDAPRLRLLGVTSMSLAHPPPSAVSATYSTRHHAAHRADSAVQLEKTCKTCAFCADRVYSERPASSYPAPPPGKRAAPAPSRTQRAEGGSA